ncbi:hypothetical protein MCANUFG1_01491 [Mycoplasmopsis canis UFG1]|uniref:hypothetical protein n=1 Tax=Mycoplasmopsis canis TaxID=29555 RepID=UPI00025AFA0A|nr:hypothetical protein [Mycoplasmopsis canis]EIE41511.1 hypothetical protein MCANUFG1_01491 [Mycoplasmopsis canis UFG1]
MKNIKVYLFKHENSDIFLNIHNKNNIDLKNADIRIERLDLENNLFQVFKFTKTVIDRTIYYLKRIKWEKVNKKDFEYLDKLNKFEDKLRSVFEFEQFENIEEFISKVFYSLLQNPRLVKSNKRFYLTFLIVYLRSLGLDLIISDNFEKEFDLYYFFIALSNVETRELLSDSFFSSTPDFDASELHKKLQATLKLKHENSDINKRHTDILNEIKIFIKEKTKLFEQNFLNSNQALKDRGIIMPTEKDIDDIIENLMKEKNWERIYNKLILLSKI